MFPLAKMVPIGYHIQYDNHTDIEIVRGACLALMDESEYDGLLEFLARNYLKGDIIAGSGGVRNSATPDRAREKVRGSA
jgi:hypothetical protein